MVPRASYALCRCSNKFSMSFTLKSSFDLLVERHAPGVFRVCRSILHDEHLGFDASQETFAKLWQHLNSGDAPERIGPWLRRVALSTSLDLARKRRLRPVIEEDQQRAGAEHQRPLEQASLLELQSGLGRALGCLSEGQRTTFLLRHEGGFALAEIAELLEQSISTVKTQFARACLKLQAKLARFDPTSKELTR